MHCEKNAAGFFLRRRVIFSHVVPAVQTPDLVQSLAAILLCAIKKYQTIHPWKDLVLRYQARRFLSSRILSAIMAINSLLVGLPRRL